jgi:nitrogen regulatory protein P-II 1
MKKIEAVIRTSKFEEVKDALHLIDIDFFSYMDATGVGNEKKKSEQTYRGTHLDTAFIPRRALTIVVRDQNVKKTVDCLLDAAFTGEVGDGRIFVSPIEGAWKIRTKESGDDSLKGEDEK